MPMLVISLLAILAGTLLLMKIRKEDIPGKIFCFISWFFIVVGFLLFALFVAGGICKLKNHCCPANVECRTEMILNRCHPGMPGGPCCPMGMGDRMGGIHHGFCRPGCTGNDLQCRPGCIEGDSTMKCSPKQECTGHDSTKSCCPGHKP